MKDKDESLIPCSSSHGSDSGHPPASDEVSVLLYRRILLLAVILVAGCFGMELPSEILLLI